MGNSKCLAAGADKVAFQRFLRREGDRVQQQVQFAEFLTDDAEDAGDFVVFGHIARQNQCVRAEGASQLLDIFFQPLALVREG